MPPQRLSGQNPQARSKLREPPAPPGGVGARVRAGASASGGAVVAGADGSGRLPARPPPACGLRWLGGGSAGLLLPAELTCTQRRVTSPASPPQLAASRSSVSAPEASAALPAPLSRGHGLFDTFSPGELEASAAGAAAAASALLPSPSPHPAESLSRPRRPLSSSPRRSWDRRTVAGRTEGRTGGRGKHMVNGAMESLL